MLGKTSCSADRFLWWKGCRKQLNLLSCDLPVALAAPSVQSSPGKQDTGASLDSRQPLRCWLCSAASLTFASPATAGDSEPQTQTGNTKGTSCTLCWTSTADTKHLRATSPGGRFPSNAKTSQEPDELLDRICRIFAIICSFHLNMICLNKQPARLQVPFHPIHVALDR